MLPLIFATRTGYFAIIDSYQSRVAACRLYRFLPEAPCG
jgi:hypothetical protein